MVPSYTILEKKKLFSFLQVVKAIYVEITSVTSVTTFS